ncbi:MAG TPA: efflux RND transporter periplasmic adaptor subunit [Vicinamibacterales bacterium]|nr:efflux RND transporter periplasmic adaptor subunit [Vicinamibacterales bacterium]
MKRMMTSGVFAAGLAVAACGPSPRDQPAERSAVSAVLETVHASDMADVLDAGGSIRSRTVAVLSSRILAPVVAIHVVAGDRVRAGQPLVVLEDRALQAERARAEASLAAALQAAGVIAAEQQAAGAALTLAGRTHERMSTLRERNSATAGELDEAVAALRAAEARATGAEARKLENEQAIEAARAAAQSASAAAAYGLITAPFDGIVTARSIDPGSLAAPGAPLVTVEDDRHYRLELSVDGSRAAGLRLGIRVPVSIESAPPLQLEGVVSEVGRALDPIAQTAVVKIDLPQADVLRTGLFARASLPGSVRRMLTVPPGAVVRRGQLSLVFVEHEGTARMRLVHTGRELGGRVEILAGLADGERVVVDPPGNLTDGTPLSTRAAAKEGGQP